jgi:RNase P/RNase MRP subunit p29
MEIGDKILVTYSDDDQKAGRIVGATAKMWKVEFDGESKQTRVMKNKSIVLIDDPTTTKPEVITIDTRSLLAKIMNKIKGILRKK